MTQNTQRKKPRLNKKFRFQLLVDWLTSQYAPCHVLDVAGGKGLLSYLLIAKGWTSTVVDPSVTLPFEKFKDIESGKRIKVTEEDFEGIPRIADLFKPEMVKEVDLVVGLHAHGTNISIINACKEYDKDFLLMPCCVVDEPITKVSGVNWFESLVDYSTSLGFEPKVERLNFKGKSRFLYTTTHLKLIDP